MQILAVVQIRVNFVNIYLGLHQSKGLRWVTVNVFHSFNVKITQSLTSMLSSMQGLHRLIHMAVMG